MFMSIQLNPIKKTYIRFSIKKNHIPLVDAKIAISRDYLTINKDDRWITNFYSRKRVHLIRSQYDAVMSTSKSINLDL